MSLSPRNITIVSIVIIGVLLLIRLALVFSYSLDLDGTEHSFILLGRITAWQGTMYRNPLAAPYLGVIFNPLYLYLIQGLEWLWHLDSWRDIHTLLVLARTVSLLAVLGSLYLFYLFFKLLGIPFYLYCVCTLAYLLLVIGHLYATRPDSILVLLFLVFLYSTIQYLWFRASSLYLCVALVAGILSFYFKQDAIINVAVVLVGSTIYLLQRRSYILIASFSVAFALTLYLAYLIYGRYYFTNTLNMNIQIIERPLFSFNFFSGILSVIRCSPLLWMSGLLFCKSVNFFKSKNLLNLLSFIAFPLLILIHIVMYRGGGFINYTFEAILLALLAFALFAKDNSQSLGICLRSRRWWLLIYLLFLICCNIVLHTYVYRPSIELSYKNDFESKLIDRKAVSQIIGNKRTFFPNFKNVLFFTDKNIIYGYDMHIDRYLEVLLGTDPRNRVGNEIKRRIFQLHTRPALVDTDNYEKEFIDGSVTYIVVNRDSYNQAKVKLYYPLYQPSDSTVDFLIYQYSRS